MLSNPNLLESVATFSASHSRGSEFYNRYESCILRDLPQIHSPTSSEVINLGEIGSFKFPFFNMGNISSANLFGLDEIILFSFYYANRKRYKNMLDLGANIGLHTLIMRKLGFNVVSYEPDATHLEQFKKIMELNNFDMSGVRSKAISNKNDIMEYIRVLGNTTGSHLSGAKSSTYGETETIKVETDDILSLLKNEKFDFIKMDVEGHEVVLLDRITPESITDTDIMLEIGSKKNANDIFKILNDKKIPAYAQKINWQRIKRLEDLPSHHSMGSVFLSVSSTPHWGD